MMLIPYLEGMMKITYMTLAALCVCLSWHSPLEAQSGFSDSENSQGETPSLEGQPSEFKDDSEIKRKVPRKKRRKRRHRRAKSKRPMNGTTDWFPSWQVPSFDFGLEPIMGYRMKHTRSGGITSRCVTAEGGLRLRLDHIPMPGGNPGFFVSPRGGMSKGYEVLKKSDETATRRSGFTRTFGGPSLRLLVNFFSYLVSADAGHLEYDEPEFEDARNLRLVNEPSILLRPGWMIALTSTNMRIWRSQFSEPLYKEEDLWLHSRKDFGVLEAYIDLGPGVSRLTQFLEGRRVGSGESSYVLGLAGMKLFWKIRGDLRFKYIAKASRDLDAAHAELLLPDQDVSNPTGLATMPPDSYETLGTIGARDLVAGFGLVWSYHEVLYNVSSKKGDRTREIDSGYQLTYSLSI